MLAPVKSGDVMSFRNFHNLVLNCETLSKIKNWNSLEKPETLCVLVSKLLGDLRDIWNRTVQGIKELWQGTMFVRFFWICKRGNNIGQ